MPAKVGSSKDHLSANRPKKSVRTIEFNYILRIDEMENYREKYFRVGNNAEFNRLLADDPHFSPEVKKLMRKPETHEELMAGVRKIREAIRDRSRYVVILKPHPRMVSKNDNGDSVDLPMKYVTLVFGRSRIMVLGKSDQLDEIGGHSHRDVAGLLEKLIKRYDPGFQGSRSVLEPSWISGGLIKFEDGEEVRTYGKSESYGNNSINRENTRFAIRQVLPELRFNRFRMIP